MLRNRCDQRRRGAVLVETALVMMATVVMIVGMLDVAIAVMQIHYVNNRARSTARWAATHTDDVTQIKNFGAYGTTTAKSGPGAMGLLPSHINVEKLNAATPNYSIRVTINKPLKMFSPLLAGTYNTKPAVATSPVESLGASE